MAIDQHKIDKTVLALLHDGCRAWKTFDWNSLNPLDNRFNVPQLVGGAVGPVDHDDQLDQFILYLLAQRVFVLSREILRRGHRPQQDVVGLFIDRQMLILRRSIRPASLFAATALTGGHQIKWLNDSSPAPRAAARF